MKKREDIWRFWSWARVLITILVTLILTVLGFSMRFIDEGYSQGPLFEILSNIFTPGLLIEDFLGVYFLTDNMVLLNLFDFIALVFQFIYFYFIVSLISFIIYKTKRKKKRK